MENNGVKRQVLYAEVIEMSNPDVERLIVEKDQLLNSGLAIEAFENAIIVHETPVLLGILM